MSEARKIWVHKQSEVILAEKPKGLMNSLYDEYHHVEEIEQLQAENERLKSDNKRRICSE